MPQHPSNPYRAPQAAPSQRSLPRRDSRNTNRGPFVPAAPALNSQPPELAQRYELLSRLGVPPVANEDFDDLARNVAERARFLYGFVNLFLDEQTFVGLHQPPTNSGFVIVGRTMSRDHGWCPEVMARRKALPLHDVHASPRFSGNAVVDAVGIRSYFGAPLIHASGTVLGTVCVIDPEKRSLREARHLRDIVINASSQVMDHIAHAPVR
ncbi:GAF domain-containing protein [Streptomyces sp. NPDC005840]|uniref:GAF domain-containing protein n=1 Tax=Streptomyces sp. NPDC005840 TaxID=3157072 RepID=UPI0033ED46E3